MVWVLAVTAENQPVRLYVAYGGGGGGRGMWGIEEKLLYLRLCSRRQRKISTIGWCSASRGLILITLRQSRIEWTNGNIGNPTAP